MKIENIKFKAKRLDNSEWVEGYYVKKTTRKQTPKGDVVEDGEEHLIFGMSKEDVQPLCYEVAPSTVCQFTGLKDCEGNEIWEGDILQDADYYYIKYVVIFGEGTFLARKEGHYTGIPLHECIGDSGNVTYAKVIGNKFDKEK